MLVTIDNNLKKVLKRVYDSIIANNGEISVSSREYKQTEIDALVKKGLLQKIDASTNSGWEYILKPTYEGERASAYTGGRNIS